MKFSFRDALGLSLTIALVFLWWQEFQRANYPPRPHYSTVPTRGETAEPAIQLIKSKPAKDPTTGLPMPE